VTHPNRLSQTSFPKIGATCSPSFSENSGVRFGLFSAINDSLNFQLGDDSVIVTACFNLQYACFSLILKTLACVWNCRSLALIFIILPACFAYNNRTEDAYLMQKWYPIVQCFLSRFGRYSLFVVYCHLNPLQSLLTSFKCQSKSFYSSFKSHSWTLKSPSPILGIRVPQGKNRDPETFGKN